VVSFFPRFFGLLPVVFDYLDYSFCNGLHGLYGFFLIIPDYFKLNYSDFLLLSIIQIIEYNPNNSV